MAGAAQRRRRLGLVAGLAAGVLGAALWLFGTLDRAENLTWDWRVRQAAAPSQASSRIKLVLLDQASLDWGRQVNGWGWPWPREVYTALLGFCRRGGAQSIAMDVLYTEPSIYGVWDDQALAGALAERPDAVAACFVAPDGAITWPVPEIRAAAPRLGNVSGRPDADGVFRRARPAVSTQDTVIAGLALAALGREPTTAPEILRYAPASAYQTYSAAAVIQSELRLLDGADPVLDPAVFQGCHVLFGFSAPGLLDQRPTPLDRVSPGVMVHATVLDNLLSDGFMRPAPRALHLAVVLVFGLAAGLLAVGSGRAWQTGLLFVVGLPLPLLLGLLLYRAGLWWPVAPASVATLGGLIGGLGVNWATEGRQRRFLKQAFRHYLSPHVVDRLVQDPGRLQLGGERRELTIFFSDIANFTSLGEELDPEALTALLNDFLTAMTDIVLAEGGTLDKYEGDAIIAFWNAPLDVPDHAARACRAAVLCQRELARRRPEWRARCGRDLSMRVGLHTGDVVVGNLGSRQRFDYTMLGDAANLASRLEGVNKVFGTGILASETTVLAAGGATLSRELGVVGRKEPVSVFELDGVAGENAAPSWTTYGAALEACRAGQSVEAHRLAASLEDDPAAAALAARIEADPEFRGLWNLTSK